MDSHSSLAHPICKPSHWRTQSGWGENKSMLLILMHAWTFFLQFSSDWLMVYYCFFNWLNGLLTLTLWWWKPVCVAQARGAQMKMAKRQASLLTFTGSGEKCSKPLHSESEPATSSSSSSSSSIVKFSQLAGDTPALISGDWLETPFP